MLRNNRIAVVIPAYNVGRTVRSVIQGIPPWIDNVIVVDDCSKDDTYCIVQSISDKRVKCIQHEKNTGVGGAMASGYEKAIELNADIVVKMDGDNQMDPAHLPELIRPIILKHADYVKGNRFHDFRALRAMPNIRRFGNMVLTFLSKIASGYWNMSDPNNGFTAIHCNALNNLNRNAINKGYFYENSMLINLRIINAVVRDVPIPAKYGEEKSSLSLIRAIFTFPFLMIFGLMKRIFWLHFFYDLTPISIFIGFGTILTAFGFTFGIIRWYNSIMNNVQQSAGTVFLAGLPFILGFQLLLQALVLDVQSVPTKPYSFIEDNDERSEESA